MPPPIVLLGTALIGAAVLFSYLFAKAALIVVLLSEAALVLFYTCLTDTARARVGFAPFVIALVMPLAAWLLSSIGILYAGMLLLVPALARKPGQVAALYLFSLLLLPGLDLTIAMGSLKLFEFGVHDALACGAALSLVAHRGWRAKVPLSLDLPFLCVLLLFVVSTARDTSVTNFLRVAVNTGLDCALPYYIVSRGVRDMDDLRRSMLHLGAAAAILSVILLYEVRTSWPIYNALYYHYGIPTLLLVKSRGGVLRAGGPFMESTSIAMVLVFCFMAAWSARGAFRSKAHHVGLLALLLAGLTAPQSRGAWIGLIIGMAFVDLYRGRVGKIAMRSLGIALAGLCLVAMARGSPQLSETLGLSGGSADTVDYRQKLFDRGMEEFRHSPLVGYSMPEVTARLDDLRQGEGIVDFVNTYIFIALVSGAIGLAIFLGTFGFYLWRLWRGRRRWLGQGEVDRSAAAFAFGALATPIEMLFFTSLGGRCQVFVFVLFAFAAAVANARSSAPAADQDRPSSDGSTAFAPSPIMPPTSPATSMSSSSPGFSNPARWSANQL